MPHASPEHSAPNDVSTMAERQLLTTLRITFGVHADMVGGEDATLRMQTLAAWRFLINNLPPTRA